MSHLILQFTFVNKKDLQYIMLLLKLPSLFHRDVLIHNLQYIMLLLKPLPQTDNKIGIDLFTIHNASIKT